jgi:phosphoglycerate kinase
MGVEQVLKGETMDKKTVRDVNLEGKRVLMRADFNVPLDGSTITDDTRIRAALPTIKYIIDQGGALILMSHLGRPKGVDAKYSLQPVADRLGELLGQEVKMAPAVVGEDVEAMAKALKPGEVMVLENTRFESGETKNNPELVEKLAVLGEVYVNDAFGSAHRAHASTVGVAEKMPAVAGFLMEKEINFLSKAVENPEPPYIVILGGAKVSDKIAVIENLLGKADTILVGGGMANTFLKAKGLELADSLVEDDVLGTAADLMEKAKHKLVLPVDAVVADAFDNDANRQVVAVNAVPAGSRILDIGPETITLFKEMLAEANTVVWNGPMGVFEMSNFAEGTFAIARTLAELEAVTIIGGGDSASAVNQAGVADSVSHVSTGGGASLEFFEGKLLPGLAALNDK